jgi:hypothetical protein
MSKVCHTRCFPGVIRIARIKTKIHVCARGCRIDLQIVLRKFQKSAEVRKHIRISFLQNVDFQGVIYDSPHIKMESAEITAFLDAVQRTREMGCEIFSRGRRSNTFQTSPGRRTYVRAMFEMFLNVARTTE